MLAALCSELLALAPRRVPKPHTPNESETQKLWYFVEDHGDVVFPILALVVVALIVFGIRRA